eukprot:scaffold224066_cov34-Tisochrysis_lutea.AAC.2
MRFEKNKVVGHHHFPSFAPASSVQKPQSIAYERLDSSGTLEIASCQLAKSFGIAQARGASTHEEGHSHEVIREANNEDKACANQGYRIVKMRLVVPTRAEEMGARVL